MPGLTYECDVHFKNGHRSRRRMLEGVEPKPIAAEPGRVPRVSRLMALAIRFETLVRTGEVQDYAELARLAHVTRARMTQITNLLHLAPQLQEDLLFLPRSEGGHDAITEKEMRPITAVTDWREQRRMWNALT